MSRPGMICPVCGHYLRSNGFDVLIHAAWHLPRELMTGQVTRFLWKNDRRFRPVMAIGFLFFTVEIIITILAVRAAHK